jgi:putative ABC transport system permease protein
MSLALRERPSKRPSELRDDDGGRPARRAVVRWAWRLFRREWHRQALILALLTVAVAATTVGVALVSNAVQLGPDPSFGTANTIITLPGHDPDLTADIAYAQSRFGTIDVITHQTVAVPGSVSTIDIRAENPAGPYAHVMLRLDAGRYPTGPDQVAVTSNVAKIFDLHIGGVWSEGGRTLQVVGLVENPLNLLDQFALVAPGQANPPASVSILVDGGPHSFQQLNFPSGANIGIGSRGTVERAQAEALVLVLATLAMLFVGLLAVAGFAVIAQRRLRALGMLGALGATDRHVRLVMLANGAAVGACAALVGTAVGLAGWFAFAPALGSIIDRRIDRFNLPWWAIATAMALAFVTAVAAAWWPARAAARIPVVAALSGRPPRPQPAHRFAALGGLLLGSGLVLLAFADQHRAAFVVSGTVVTVLGLLLLAPLAIRTMAAAGRGAPIAVRLALRDLDRYQARSGAALGAVTLAIGVTATIAISAAAAQTPQRSSLPANQVIVSLAPGGIGPGNPTPLLTPTQIQALQTRVDQLATALHGQAALPLEEAYNPQSTVLPAQTGGPGGGPGGEVTASLAKVISNQRGQEVNPVAEVYVATPALLEHYGIKSSQIDSNADLLTSQPDLGGLQLIGPLVGSPGPSGTAPGQAPPGRRGSMGIAHPDLQILKQLPSYSSDPNTLITSHAMQILDLQALPSGWLIQTARPLTTAQIDAAQKTAAAAGVYLETNQVQKSLAPLRDWSTLVGILVALGVLAMTVGLIRSDSGSDLRTLTATGASSSSRRTLTGATAGALALLGAVLGTAGAYGALLAWHRSNLQPLSHVPTLNLIIIVAGLPLIATIAGWLLAGREPPGMARQPLE